MLLVVFVGLAAALVPVARGRLSALAQVRFERLWLLAAAFLLQLGLAVFEGPRDLTREVIHLGSYVAAISFLFANRRIPGMWLIGVGAAMNVIVIAANGGVMPASSHALAAAGYPTGADVGHFSNSMVIAAPRLAFLGDIFAVPKSWPLSNVFSSGDVCVALGVALTIHRITGSRLLPSGSGEIAPLFRQPTFMRLWSSQVVSNLGDWTYSLAVAATLAQQTRSPQALAFLLIAQVGPAALLGGPLGGLGDRFSRIRVMISADLVRAVAVASLLLGPPPSPLHIYAVAACLGIFGSIFQPSLQASIPNVVGEKHLVGANSLVGATFNFAIMAGPAIGGLLVGQIGPLPVFAINACSFVVSAALIAGIRLPHSSTPVPGPKAMAQDLVDGTKYALRTPLVRHLLLILGILVVAAASKAPLESLFVLGTLSLGPQALGLVTGSWGLGMLLGSIAAPAASKRWSKQGLLAFSMLLVGCAVLAASQARDLETVLLAWLVAGSCNAIGNVSWQSMLQERTPDAFRGRVFAAFEVVINIAYLTGAFLAGWLGTSLGVRASYVFSGALFLAGAYLCTRLLFVWRKRAVVVGFDSGSRRRAVQRPAEPAASDESVAAEPEPEPDYALVGANPPAEEFTADADDASEWFPAPDPAAFDFSSDDDSAEPDLHIPDDPSALMSSYDPDDRIRGIELAAASASSPLVGAIINALGDPAAQVRRRAAVEIGDLGLTEAIGALDHALDDIDESVRAAAVEALGRIDDDDVLASLVTALKDPVAEVREAAEEALLSRESSSVIPILAEALGSRSIRVAATHALARMGSDAASLMRALADPEPDVRRRAAELLGEVGDAGALDELERTARDPIPEVAEAAQRSLERLSPSPRRGGPTLPAPRSGSPNP